MAIYTYATSYILKNKAKLYSVTYVFEFRLQRASFQRFFWTPRFGLEQNYHVLGFRPCSHVKRQVYSADSIHKEHLFIARRNAAALFLEHLSIICSRHLSIGRLPSGAFRLIYLHTLQIICMRDCTIIRIVDKRISVWYICCSFVSGRLNTPSVYISIPFQSKFKTKRKF